MHLFRPYDKFFDEPIQKKSERHPNWFLYVAAYVIRPVVKLLWRYEVHGRENIPAQSEAPVVYACNHLSFLDPVLLWVATYPRITRMLARANLYRMPVLRAVYARVGAWPVQPESSDTPAIKRAACALKRGECVGIFPEGTRMNSADKEYKPHAGVVLIAKMGRAKIVPVGVKNTDLVMPKGTKIPRFPKLHISFGEPIDLADFTDVPKAERNDVVLTRVMSEIQALCK